MKQCLVTKLRESVSDSSLLRIGEKLITLFPNGVVKLQGTGVQVRAIGGQQMVVNGAATNSYTAPDGNLIHIQNLTNDNLIIAVSNISQLISIIREGNGTQFSIDLGFFESAKNMVSIGLAYQSISGTLSAFKAVNLSSKIRSFDFSRSVGVSGDIKDISHLPFDMENPLNLPNINFSDCPNITGEMIDFIVGQRNIGQTSGAIKTGWWAFGTQLTFNGQPIGNINAENSLSWTADTITFNETTINA